MKTSRTVIAIFIGMAALISGCGNTGGSLFPSSTPASTQASTASGITYGKIDAIERTTQEIDGIAGTGVGTGAVIGGVVGGVLGHQVGSGTGQDIATVAGVVGGAMAGHQIEKSRKQGQDGYRIRVRLDNGQDQTVTQPTIGDLRVGDRVRIENNTVYRQ